MYFSERTILNIINNKHSFGLGNRAITIGMPPSTSPKSNKRSIDEQGSQDADGSLNGPGSAGKSQKYMKVSGREHILLRPDMYTGSTDPEVSSNTIIDESGLLVTKEFETVSAFLQCVEEIMMNAADRVAAFHEENSTIVQKTKTIKIEVTEDYVSVFNDGDGIDSDVVEEYGIHAPELIFGHLRSSSNYEDSNKRLNSGRNGLGAKITNVFSKRFTVETVSPSGFKYKQVFEDNMSVINKPKITKFSGRPYTLVTFEPDFVRLNMPDKIGPDIQGIIRRRAYEISVTSYEPVKVHFNKSAVTVNTVDKYMSMYVPEASNRFSANVNERWRICVGFTPENEKFRAVSFCNSTATLENGRHVDHVVDPLVKRLSEYYRKKFKSTKIKNSVIKDSLTVFVSGFIENPLYSSQCKNFLSLSPDKFGSSCVVPDSIFNKLVKSGLTTHVEDIVKNKDSKALNATDGKKSSKIKGVPKLHDAAKAGTRESEKCVLFLCEGDSALTMLLSGLTSANREWCGCFPLKGKLLNVRDASSTQVAGNLEIANIKKILGLQQGKVYASTKELRYGKVILITDQDLDGSHIKGLLLNMFDIFWPGLITSGYIQNMTTPIVRATGPGGAVKLFYNEFEYEQWKSGLSNLGSWKIKYLKGLGSSTSSQSKEYFKDFTQALVSYSRDEEADVSMKLAFSKDRANARKKWLSSYDPSEIIHNNQKDVTMTEFIHRELKHFSEGDVRRSIPSSIDGLKVSQRKILYGSFMRGIQTNEMKVAQLCGYIADKSCYHHGEVSLSSAITSMAQDFVGSNNINLLLPKGQLGSRLQGGKDAASPRYTFVQMNPVTPLIFRPEDSPVLSYTSDDGVNTEPVYYVPVIPMALVNGLEGIGSGFSTSVPSYNPRDLMENIRRRLNGQAYVDIHPWYRGFNGSIEPVDTNYRSKGNFEIEGNRVRITELPVGTWTSNYKIYLESLVEKKLITSYTERCTDAEVDFTVIFPDDSSVIKLVETSSLVSVLKLSSSIRTSNMHCYSALNNVKKFEDVSQIQEEHFVTRLETYRLRKEFQIKVLEHEVELFESKARFINSKLSGEIVIEKVAFEEVMSRLVSLNFPKLGKSFDDSDKSFGYLTSLNMFDVTKERVSKLLATVEAKNSQLDRLRVTKPEDMWLSELDVLEKAL